MIIHVKQEKKMDDSLIYAISRPVEELKNERIPLVATSHHRHTSSFDGEYSKELLETMYYFYNSGGWYSVLWRQFFTIVVSLIQFGFGISGE